MYKTVHFVKRGLSLHRLLPRILQKRWVVTWIDNRENVSGVMKIYWMFCNPIRKNTNWRGGSFLGGGIKVCISLLAETFACIWYEEGVAFWLQSTVQYNVLTKMFDGLTKWYTLGSNFFLEYRRYRQSHLAPHNERSLGDCDDLHWPHWRSRRMRWSLVEGSERVLEASMAEWQGFRRTSGLTHQRLGWSRA